MPLSLPWGGLAFGKWLKNLRRVLDMGRGEEGGGRESSEQSLGRWFQVRQGGQKAVLSKTSRQSVYLDHLKIVEVII